MTQEFIKKIKSRGYWRINFQPLVDKEKLEVLSNCKEIVEKNKVELRGWDYPHFPRRTGADTNLIPGENYYEGWVDWWNHKEFWRMYKSGQFLHYLALREDWFEDSEWDQQLSQKIKPMTVLGILGSVVYQVTEIFEFLSRLTSNGLYDEGVRVSVSLNNIKGRGLWIDDPRRMPLFYELETGAEKLTFEKEYTKDQILSTPKELAFEIIMKIFDSFGWENIPVEVIKNDQVNFLAGKI